MMFSRKNESDDVKPLDTLLYIQEINNEHKPQALAASNYWSVELMIKY